MTGFGRGDPESRRREAREVERRLQETLKREALRASQAMQHQMREAMSMQQKSARDAAAEYQSANEHYAQIVMVVGYGAFFTLWLQTQKDMSAWLFASTGLGITVSLLVFVGFELGKTLIAGIYLPRVVKGTMSDDDYNAKIDRYMASWGWAFGISAATGLAAGLSLFFWFMYRTVTIGMSMAT